MSTPCQYTCLNCGNSYSGEHCINCNPYSLTGGAVTYTYAEDDHRRHLNKSTPPTITLMDAIQVLKSMQRDINDIKSHLKI